MLAEGPNTQTYDANGSTSGTTIPGEGAYSHSYDDYENRVTGITLGRAGQAYPNATTASFRYNGDGLRVRVREPDSAEEDYFLYDGVRPYMRMESAQGLPRAVYVSEGGTYYSPIVTLRTANANWTYLRDGMESVRKILNESQTTTDAYTFQAFGNPTGQAGTTVNPFRYVGALGYYWFDFAHHGRDRTSGLRLLGARYYGPSPRRFWTRDPGKDGVNWYVYVADNPVNRTDPSGMSWDPVLVFCAASCACALTAVLGAYAGCLAGGCRHIPDYTCAQCVAEGILATAAANPWWACLVGTCIARCAYCLSPYPSRPRWDSLRVGL
jgi:RHS repeat-associated protein